MYSDEAVIEQKIERFFELMGEEVLTPQQDAEVNNIIQFLGWTEADLSDIAAQCARRAIYLQNTTQH